MGAFFVYILKAAICLSVFYLFYRLLLARETFHRFNRFAVLGTLLISLIIPFCEMKVTQQSELHQTMLSIEQLLLMADLMSNSPVLEAQRGQAAWVYILLFTYLAGILFFVCRNIYSLIRLCMLLKSGKRRKLEGNVSLIIHRKNDLAPFSWMQYIVISQHDLEENGSEILIHELAHIRKRHSIDLLIADICIFFQWFNPAAWLLKQELQNIHEYEADEAVIKEGIDAKQYQLLIIKKAVGTRLYSMANGFNHSKLKKRITMMLKEKSSPWAKLKYLYVLPLAAIAVSAFARPEISNELKGISEVKVNDLTAIVIANADEKQGVKQDFTSSENNPEQAEASQNKEQSRPEEQNAESSRSHKELGSTLEISSSSPIKIYGPKDGKEPLVIIDGKESTPATMQSLSPNRIKSIDVLKDKSATEQYGDKGANGVIIIKLFTDEEFAEKQNKPRKNVIEMAQNQLLDNALVLLDGVEVSGIDGINPEDISIVGIYKPTDIESANSPESAAIFKKYGERAKNGVLDIVSKKNESLPLNGSAVVVYSNKKNSVMIQVQGLVADRDNKPIVGAAVIVAGKTTGTITDTGGKFILECDQNDKLIISYINMKSVSVEAAPKVTVTMEKE